ncbi:unnamed protein product [Amaranthus hypochondriacus]
MASSLTDSTSNPASIYYLHPSDHAGTKLVSTQFDGTGYSDWTRSMLISLTAKNKMSFVDGTLPEPSPSSSDHSAWIRCNNMVIGWLIASMDRSIAKSIMYCATAREIWSELEERFGQASLAQLYSLQEALMNMRQAPDQHIAEYFTKMKAVWDELDHLSPLPYCTCSRCSCGLTKKFLTLHQEQRMMHFLMKVHEGFQQVRTNILMLDQSPSVSQVYRLLLQEQRHKELSNISVSTPDFLAFASDRKSPFVRSSNSSVKASVSGTKRTSRYFCDHCKISGHSVDRCFKLHGYPNAPKPGKRIAAVVQNVTDASPLEATGLTQIQFNNLLSILGKHNSHDLDSSPDPTPILNTPHLAGPFDEKASGAW